jgi:hypothetical protein
LAPNEGSAQEVDQQSFAPYWTSKRLVGRDFEFLIADETGKAWYDRSQDLMTAERAWCSARIQAGGTVVDCGAHHGVMSALMSLCVGESGTVWAYELLPSKVGK